MSKEISPENTSKFQVRTKKFIRKEMVIGFLVSVFAFGAVPRNPAAKNYQNFSNLSDKIACLPLFVSVSVSVSVSASRGSLCFALYALGFVALVQSQSRSDGLRSKVEAGPTAARSKPSVLQ